MIFAISSLPLAVAHRRQDRAHVVLLERLRDRADRPRPRVDDLRGAGSLRRHDPRADLHLTVRQGRAVLDHQDPLATDRIGSSTDTLELAFTTVAAGSAPRSSTRVSDLLLRRRVDLVDHDHVRPTEVGLARVVSRLVSHAERVDEARWTVGT